jgi:galactokinase
MIKNTNIKKFEEFKELISESHEMENYMFFANITNIKRMCEEILEMDPSTVDSRLTDGHGWAVDHIATSKDDVEEVYGFLKSESKELSNTENGLISDNNN